MNFLNLLFCMFNNQYMYQRSNNLPMTYSNAVIYILCVCKLQNHNLPFSHVQRWTLPLHLQLWRYPKQNHTQDTTSANTHSLHNNIWHLHTNSFVPRITCLENKTKLHSCKTYSTQWKHNFLQIHHKNLYTKSKICVALSNNYMWM